MSFDRRDNAPDQERSAETAGDEPEMKMMSLKGRMGRKAKKGFMKRTTKRRGKRR